jgi:hypothetical protein
VLVGAFATLLLGVLGGLDASTAPRTATSTPEAAGAASRADAPGGEPIGVSARASRTPVVRTR